ncbi:hypothetical protein C8R45DRAFT_909866 [Mycena sanguinolenta]|nr:hypothetical protein C8R45DRAFT_909866 [Mycena sanguinolenta]
MFFRYYHHPGCHLPLGKQVELRKELLAIARTSFNPIPDYQCLSSRPDAFDDKLIVVSQEPDRPPRPVAFTSAMYLDVEDVEHAVLHTGLTIAAPSVQRTGILVQLFAHLFLNVMPLHPGGMWVTTLAAVLSSLVQSGTMLSNTYPRPPTRQSNPQPVQEHLEIARVIDERYRAQLLISPDAEWDAESFVFRGSMDWGAAEVFKKDVDDARFWHRDSSANAFFRGLMRPGKGDEVLLVGFIDGNRLWEVLEQWQRQKARL